jgi:uncharacterized protein (TIGR03067 family)
MPSSQADKGNSGSSKFALDFNGSNAYVATPVRYDGSYPLTIEAWTNCRAEKGSNYVIGDSEGGGVGLLVRNGRYEMNFRPTTKSSRPFGAIDATATDRATLNRPCHLAGTLDENEVRLYVDGVLKASSKAAPIKASLLPLAIGANPNGRQPPPRHVSGGSELFNGWIREVRISKTIRYSSNFTPAERFETDANTVALYHCDEGTGTVLADSSGNNHTATIVNAQWIKVGDDSGPSADARGVHSPSGSKLGRPSQSPQSPMRRPKEGSEASSSNPNAESPNGKPSSDATTLLGSWEIIAVTSLGTAQPKSALGRIVFAEDGITLDGFSRPEPYELNTAKNPKELSFGIGLPKNGFLAIYELKGVELRICMPSASGSPRPTAFESTKENNCNLIVCKRSQLASIVPNVSDKIDPGLASAIDRMIELLERGKIENLLDNCMEPDLVKRATADERKQMIDQITKSKGKMLNTVRALKKIVPEMTPDKTEAVFNLAKVQIENGLPFSRAVFMKIGSNWYMKN